MKILRIYGILSLFHPRLFSHSQTPPRLDPENDTMELESTAANSL